MVRSILVSLIKVRLAGLSRMGVKDAFGIVHDRL
jgi:hypothetical protein